MTGVNTDRLNFRTPSTAATCVEVALSDTGSVYVRDSKNPETVLGFTTEEWDVFKQGVADGFFD